jgi:Xaa-Pro dipeptidase
MTDKRKTQNLPWSKGPKMRSKRLFEILDRFNLDLCVVSYPKHVYYFTGFRTAKPILPTYLFVFRTEEPILLTGETDFENACSTFGGEVLTYVNYNVAQRMLAYPDFVSEIARKRILEPRKKTLKKIGIETWHTPEVLLSYLDHDNNVRFVDISKEIMEMRKIKDEDEIQKIKQSCKLNDYAYSVAKPACVPGRREIEVYSIVHSALSNKVGTFQYFAGDFVSGKRAARGGGPPTARVLRRGDTFYLDLWVTVEEYWSDTSRTFVIGGSPASSQKKILAAVKDALNAGEEKLQPGTSASEVYRVVHDSLKKSGYGKYFNQHAGHSLGLDGQEAPFLIPASQEPLREGMVCAIEPGLFSSRFGIQIEDDYLIKRRGIEKLTKFPYDL